MSLSRVGQQAVEQWAAGENLSLEELRRQHSSPFAQCVDASDKSMMSGNRPVGGVGTGGSGGSMNRAPELLAGAPE